MHHLEGRNQFPAEAFQENLELYEIEQQKAAGHPPHFTQTLVSAVAADGESARFEGIVTGMLFLRHIPRFSF